MKTSICTQLNTTKRTIRRKLHAIHPELPVTVVLGAVDAAEQLACEAGFAQLTFPLLAVEMTDRIIRALEPEISLAA